MLSPEEFAARYAANPKDPEVIEAIEQANATLNRILETWNKFREDVIQAAKDFVEYITNVFADLAEQLDTTPEGLIAALAAVYGDQPQQALGS